MEKKLYDIGESPPIGVIPPKMHAWLVRSERFGEPIKAFQEEVIDVPEIKDDEILVYVMAAGINYNNIWAGLGEPVNVISARNKTGEPEDFHVGGSDGSGIVYKIGKAVTEVKVGDHVVLHCGTWDKNCNDIKRGKDPMYSTSFKIWGFETNYGSFAQFTVVQEHQALPKPKHLSWEAAASYMLVGATAYRMLLSWEPHAIKENDAVLIWGGAGGLGSIATQIVKAKGGRAIAVVSDESKVNFCKSLGAIGCINRNNYDHWGILPDMNDKENFGHWLEEARKFGRDFWEVLGEKRGADIVFEHPGESTIPTSIFICETGGMVVICGGTSGYHASVDIRYHWMRQKRLQGSHFANDDQAKGVNDLMCQKQIDPCLSRSFTYKELPDSHQLMYKNEHPPGNMAVLIGSPDFNQGIE